jgi:hypothetical protein
MLAVAPSASKESVTAKPAVVQPDSFAAFDSTVEAPILQRKTCPCGGGCPHCQTHILQPKLAINQPGDAYEQEADRVAEEVMRMPDPSAAAAPAIASAAAVLQRKCACGDQSESGLCSECAKKEELQRFAAGPTATPEAPPIVRHILRQPGVPLDASTRAFFEPRFGRDFSTVRVHTDSRAAVSARAVNARAYTVGRDIVFDEGQYSPRSTGGKTLLAHELAHTIQQGPRSASPWQQDIRHAAPSTVLQRDLATPSPDVFRPSQPDLTDSQIQDAIDYNRSVYDLAHTVTIQSILGGPVTGSWTANNIRAIVATQERFKLRPDGKVGPLTFGPIKSLERHEAVLELRYVCIFVGQQELFGRQARRFTKTVMPDHRLIEASSMEEALVKIMDNSTTALKGGTAAHIKEIVLIAHGNASGFLKIPLVKGLRGTTPEELGQLQDNFKKGVHAKFQEARADVLRLFDDDTRIVVRGCRLGRSQEAVDALAAFFGGHVEVFAPKEYQAFTRRRISSFAPDPREAAIKAFDHLAMQGFVQQDIVASDEQKVRWVAGHLPDGFVPESFFVDEKNVANFGPSQNADNPAIQGMKDYLSSEFIGGEKWGIGTGQGSSKDPDLSALTTAVEVIEEARSHLDELRRLERDDPENWKAIGFEAWWVLRCDRNWHTRDDAVQIDPSKFEPRDYGHPRLGLYMPGLSYDTNVLTGQAARRPDLQVLPPDEFLSTDLVLPPTPPSGETDDDLNQAGSQTESSRRGIGPSRIGPSDDHSTGELKLGEDRITATPKMPEPPLTVDFGHPQNPALVVRGEFSRSFDISFQRQLLYLKVKRATVDFNGKVDFKGEGQKELVFSTFGALSEGKARYGEKFEETLAKGTVSDTGISGKITGGLEVGGSQDRANMRTGPTAKLVVGAQVSWGPVAEQLKLVIIGVDATKQGTDVFTILGIEWSPIIVKGEYDLPARDGTTVRFTGVITLTIVAEPDWALLAERFAPALGRQVVAGPNALVSGGSSADLFIYGAFVAGGALSIYSYYRSVEDIEDLKELKRGADQGWDDFYGGYLAYYGISAGGQPSGSLWKEGQRHAEINAMGRTRIAARAYNEWKQQKIFADDDPALRDAIREGTKDKYSESMSNAVSFSYEQAVRTLFFKAWLERQSGTTPTVAALYNARARAGLRDISGDLVDEPDYGWVNSVGSQGAAGMRRPNR